MAQNLLLISVDSPVLMGIYEDCKLVKSFSAEGKFSDVLPQLFSEILAEYFKESPTNSSIADEFLGLCEASNEDRTLSPSRKRAEALPKKSLRDEFALDSANRRISSIFYANGPGNFSAIKLTHIFLQTLSIAKNINLFCADAFHFSNGEFINAYSKVHFYKEGGEIRTKTLSAKQQNHFSLPRVLDMSIFSSKCEPLYILPAV